MNEIKENGPVQGKKNSLRLVINYAVRMHMLTVT